MISPAAQPGRTPLDRVARLLAGGERAQWSALAMTPAAFLRVCSAEDVGGLVHDTLSRGTADEWPEEVIGSIGRLARAEAAREMVRREELTAVFAALHEAGVRPVLFKGTALAYGLYGAPGWRPRADTDLLVRREDVDRVVQAMTRMGYARPAYCGGEQVFGQFPLVRSGRFGIHHVADVHWRISTQPYFADLLTWQELDSEAVPLPLLGAPARAASPVQAMLVACVHAAAHHRNAARLLWIYDIHLLASRLTPDEFRRFADAAVEKGVAAICAHSLARARDWYHSALPDAVARRLASRGHERTAVYLQAQRRWRHELVDSLRGLPRWRDRLRLLAEVLAPGPRYMLAAYRIGSHPFATALLPALYVHRNAVGIWKVVAGRK